MEKNSFIALPGEGGHNRLQPSKLCILTWRGSEKFYSNGSKRVLSVCGHSSGWLVVRQVGVSIIGFLVWTGLGSTSWWATYFNFSHLGGFQHLQSSSKILLCVSLEGEPEPCPKAAILFLLTVPPLWPHPLP